MPSCSLSALSAALAALALALPFAAALEHSSPFVPGAVATRFYASGGFERRYDLFVPSAYDPVIVPSPAKDGASDDDGTPPQPIRLPRPEGLMGNGPNWEEAGGKFPVDGSCWPLVVFLHGWETPCSMQTAATRCDQAALARFHREMYPDPLPDTVDFSDKALDEAKKKKKKKQRGPMKNVKTDEEAEADLARALKLADKPLHPTCELAALAESQSFFFAAPCGVDLAWNAGACCAPADGSPRPGDWRVGVNGTSSPSSPFSSSSSPIRPSHPAVDDVQAMRDLVKDIEGTGVCVDKRRIFAIGFSNGGMLAHRLACEASDLFAAVASVGGTLAPRRGAAARGNGTTASRVDALTEVCSSFRPVSKSNSNPLSPHAPRGLFASVLEIHGTEDAYLPLKDSAAAALDALDAAARQDLESGLGGNGAAAPSSSGAGGSSSNNNNSDETERDLDAIFSSDERYSPLALQGTMEAWEKLLGCTQGFHLEWRRGPAASMRWKGCRNHTQLELLAIDGLGHDWPFSSGDLNVTAYILEFFERSARRVNGIRIRPGAYNPYDLAFSVRTLRAAQRTPSKRIVDAILAMEARGADVDPGSADENWQLEVIRAQLEEEEAELDMLELPAKLPIGMGAVEIARAADMERRELEEERRERQREWAWEMARRQQEQEEQEQELQEKQAGKKEAKGENSGDDMDGLAKDMEELGELLSQLGEAHGDVTAERARAEAKKMGLLEDEEADVEEL